MMDVYLFDIDGTLTEPRQPMTPDFSCCFDTFVSSRIVYLVSGSDYSKVCEQVDTQILHHVDGVFPCAGAEFWQQGIRKGAEQHNFRPALIDQFQKLMDKSTYPHRFGNHVELRTGMLNVSVVGRNASQTERKAYRAWDENHGERKQIVKVLGNSFPDYEFSIGGEISIDIAPRGANKARILERLDSIHPDASYHFFGDRVQSGGNDWPLAHALERRDEGHRIYAVNGYKETMGTLNVIERTSVNWGSWWGRPIPPEAQSLITR